MIASCWSALEWVEPQLTGLDSLPFAVPQARAVLLAMLNLVEWQADKMSMERRLRSTQWQVGTHLQLSVVRTHHAGPPCLPQWPATACSDHSASPPPCTCLPAEPHHCGQDHRGAVLARIPAGPVGLPALHPPHVIHAVCSVGIPSDQRGADLVAEVERLRLGILDMVGCGWSASRGSVWGTHDVLKRSADRQLADGRLQQALQLQKDFRGLFCFYSCVGHIASQLKNTLILALGAS